MPMTFKIDPSKAKTADPSQYGVLLSANYKDSAIMLKEAIVNINFVNEISATLKELKTKENELNQAVALSEIKDVRQTTVAAGYNANKKLAFLDRFFPIFNKPTGFLQKTLEDFTENNKKQLTNTCPFNLMVTLQALISHLSNLKTPHPKIPELKMALAYLEGYVKGFQPPSTASFGIEALDSATKENKTMRQDLLTLLNNTMKCIEEALKDDGLKDTRIGVFSIPEEVIYDEVAGATSYSASATHEQYDFSDEEDSKPTQSLVVNFEDGRAYHFRTSPDNPDLVLAAPLKNKQPVYEAEQYLLTSFRQDHSDNLIDPNAKYDADNMMCVAGFYFSKGGDIFNPASQVWEPLSAAFDVDASQVLAFSDDETESVDYAEPRILRKRSTHRTQLNQLKNSLAIDLAKPEEDIRDTFAAASVNQKQEQNKMLIADLQSRIASKIKERSLEKIEASLEKGKSNEITGTIKSPISVQSSITRQDPHKPNEPPQPPPKPKPKVPLRPSVQSSTGVVFDTESAEKSGPTSTASSSTTIPKNFPRKAPVLTPDEKAKRQSEIAALLEEQGRLNLMTSAGRGRALEILKELEKLDKS